MKMVKQNLKMVKYHPDHLRQTASKTQTDKETRPIVGLSVVSARGVHPMGGRGVARMTSRSRPLFSRTFVPVLFRVVIH